VTDRALSVEEVATVLGVPLSSAYVYVKLMPHARVGRHIRVLESALTKWLEEGGTCPKPQQTDSFDAVLSGGRASTANASRRGTRTARPLARGVQSSSDLPPIRELKPRKARASGT
jgi:excisionase family DNA binding protein